MTYRTADATVSFHSAAEVTPDNNFIFPEGTRMLWVGSQGDIVVDMAGKGVGVTFRNVVGALDGQFTKVYATGTTATDIVRCW